MEYIQYINDVSTAEVELNDVFTGLTAFQINGISEVEHFMYTYYR